MNSYNQDTTAEEVASDCASHITNKTILVTGASPGGLGAVFATIVAKYKPACIILATLDIAKAQLIADEITAVAPAVRTHIIELNLESIERTREAATAINSLNEELDVIVNNAGIMAPPFSTTVDGIERQFAANHIGHFLLTNLLLPKILARNKPLRVVNVASNGFRYSPVRLEDWNFDDGNNYNRWIAYAHSKSANMLFSVSLAQKLGARSVVSVSLHPGVTPTNISRGLAMEDFGELHQLDLVQGHKSYWQQRFQYKTPTQGVATHVFAAFHPSLELAENNGSYLSDSAVVSRSLVHSWARDTIEAERLWSLSEELVSQEFEY
ncbi:dehydrogenase [Xylariales sp. PMI_506]|nr:dehydrogenase [Xylariales sp. PMI_506]